MAYTLEYGAPFRSDAECLRWLRFPEPPDCRRRLELFCTVYGLPTVSGMVDAVIAGQRENVELFPTPSTPIAPAPPLDTRPEGWPT
ncbi:hypothetical protein OG407_17905 [Streptomyces sp. NBC_01515]|uniref:hypothetical protein n=1 Tax=Streptomyces sp. NBC_01515 TaxID=2903890 RepID=UPI00386EE068